MKLIHADIVFSKDREHLEVHPDSYISVEKGKVKGIWPVIPEEYQNVPLTDYGDCVIIPAFSDLHVHAPQYLNRGLEMDLLLADWLEQCTFPPEAFWMATKQSGHLFGDTGSFEPDSAFDALLIDGLSDAARKLSPEQIVERFCYIGTKENIKVRFINGDPR